MAGKPARWFVIGLSGFGFWSHDIGGFDRSGARLQTLVRVWFALQP
ncbi:TIM-barrel domain-containing protein [Escherichia coli]